MARSHALTVSHGFSNEQPTTLHTLIQTIIAPYAGGDDNCQSRASVTGPDILIAGSTVTSFALLLHEFATNAAKYGALSSPRGFLDISCSESEDLFTIVWSERNGPVIDREPDSFGFGSLLARATVRGQLGGEITRDWKREGLLIKLVVATSSVRTQ